MLSSTEAERRSQIEEGARLARADGEEFGAFKPRRTLTVRRDRTDRTDRPVRDQRTGGSKPAGAPKGHEAFLKALEVSGAKVRVLMLDDPTPLIGKVKTSDKYTVSVETDDGTEVLFKHAMRQFKALTPRPQRDAAATEQEQA